MLSDIMCASNEIPYDMIVVNSYEDKEIKYFTHKKRIKKGNN